MKNFKITLTNYEFEIPSNWGIVVIANYRTGSTAFCDRLSQITGLPFLGEVFHFNPSSRPAVYDPDQQSIVKIMPNHMPPEEYWDKLFNQSFVIGLHRQDFAAQVLSFAVAYYIGRWQKEKNVDLLLPANLNFSNSKLLHFIKSLKASQEIWNNCQQFFDVTLCYEQIMSDLSESIYEVMPKIRTYNDTLERIRAMI
jgi:LPS sulfotransferase NodH